VTLVPGSRWRAIPALAWHDTRTARRRLIVSVSAISLGIAALVATDSFSADVTRSIRQQSRALLGADLALNSSQQFTAPVDSVLASLEQQGARVARATTFTSMAVVPGHPGSKLVQVRAVTPEMPFYGTIETDPAGQWAHLHEGRHALVDPSLLISLNARVGDTLFLGFARFAITGVIANVPGDVGISAAIGPRVYIPAAYLAETRLLGFGSRAQYQAMLKLPVTMSPARVVARARPVFEAQKVRARTVAETEQSLTQGIEQLNKFLGLVGLVALLLGGIGVGSAISAYIADRLDSVAVMRCLGATGPQVTAMYVIEASLLGVIGALLGIVLGVAAQLLLPKVFGDFLPVDVAPQLEPMVLLMGLAIGVWTATLFALRPVLAVRDVSPLMVLRRNTPGAEGKKRRVDVPRLSVELLLGATVLYLAVRRTGDLRQGIGMTIGIVAVVGVLWAGAAVLSALARRLVRERWPFVLRQGVANLYRPANQTRAVVLSLGFATFLLCFVYLVQSSLLGELRAASSAAQANLAFFDVQPPAVPAVDSLVRAVHAPVLQQVAIIPMRVAEVNGVPVADLTKKRQSWALRREYRSSYRDTLVASEKVTAGKWGPREAAGLPGISVEKDLAAELQVALGDTIVWDVQGVRIPSIVTSLREVQWARFEPNFFVVFEPRALKDAPASFAILTRLDDATARAQLQHDVVTRFPSASAIDLSTIQDAVRKILDKVSLAVRFLSLFSLVTGVLVLVSAVSSARRQRVREAVLLKTLGATRAQIARIMTSEYASLGALGSLTGMTLSVAAAWGVMHFIFESTFTLAPLGMLILALGTMMLTVAIGVWSGREVFRATVSEELRD
jgi:putative ABC transport system permease protein